MIDDTVANEETVGDVPMEEEGVAEEVNVGQDAKDDSDDSDNDEPNDLQKDVNNLNSDSGEKF